MFKKEKVKNENVEVTKSGEKKSLARFILSLMIAVLLFGGLVTFEKWALSKTETEPVLKCKVDLIPEGTEINQDNIKDFFYVAFDNSMFVTEANFKDFKDVPTGILACDFVKEESLLNKDITNKEDLLTYISPSEKTVEIAIKVSDIGDAVGGLLRGGDLVNISFVSKVKESSELLYSGVYVEKVFDSAGSEITRDNEDPATIIILLVSESMESEINAALANNTVKLSKTK